MSFTVETDPAIIPAPAASMSGSPAQWMVTADAHGNLWAAGGWVIQPSTPVVVEVTGSILRADTSETLETRWGRPAAQGLAATPLDGSGTLLIATSAASAAGLPVGAYRPAPDGWRCMNTPGTIAMNGTTAEISDGTDIVATLASAGNPPVGSYLSTTYGEETYYGEVPFIILVTAPEAAGNGTPSAEVAVSAGTAQTGTYTATGSATWEHETDTDWSIAIAADGTAAISDGTDTVATREAGADNDPSGRYAGTVYGITTYGSGEDFNVFISMNRVAPRAGWVWVAVVTSAGILTGATGPGFSTDMPEIGEGIYYLPLAYCDGSSPPLQIQSGAIHWPPPGGDGGATDPTPRNMIILGL